LNKQSLGLWGSFVLAVLLLIGSAAASYQEILPYIVGGRDPESKKQFMAEAGPPVGLSLQAQRLVLDDCYQAVSSLIGAEKTASGTQLAENCRQVAEDIIAQSPVFSYAWFALALTHSLDGVSDEFKTALAKSQETTANQWAMASLRLWLGYQHWADLGAPLQEQLGADIAVLATTGPGRNWLAQRYRENDAFREDVVASIEKTSPAIQRSFVRAISSLSAQ